MVAASGGSRVAASPAASHLHANRQADRAAIASARAAHGLELLDLRPATGREVTASGSSWACRLGSDRARAVVHLSGVRMNETSGGRPDRQA